MSSNWRRLRSEHISILEQRARLQCIRSLVRQHRRSLAELLSPRHQHSYINLRPWRITQQHPSHQNQSHTGRRHLRQSTTLLGQARRVQWAIVARSMPPCHTVSSLASSLVCRIRLSNPTFQDHLKRSRDNHLMEVFLDRHRVRLQATYKGRNPALSHHHPHHKDNQFHRLPNTRPPSAHRLPAKAHSPHHHHQHKRLSIDNPPSASQSSNSHPTLRNPQASSTTNLSNSNNLPHPPPHPPTTTTPH